MKNSQINQAKKVLIMAGGTGGHVFPALAIAKALQAEGISIEWLGTERGLEASIVPAAGIHLNCIAVISWRRENIIKRLLAPFFLTKAIFQSIQILRRIKPNLVLGLGGFAAGPGGIAAWLLGIPIIVHEQNAVAGATNRILACFAKKVLEGFPEGFPKARHAIWTGNPVRQEFLQVARPAERLQGRSGALRLLVVGGSQGARALNQLCPKALNLIPKANRPEVWHQAGGGHDQATREFYQDAGVEAKIEPFIAEMAEAYAWADIVLCRAGALTIAELAAVGVGSILVPFPFAVDDHQTHNGRFLERVGAAILVQQKALDPTKLAEIIIDLVDNRQVVLNMAKAAYSVAKPEATEKVIEHCKEILSK